MRTIYLFVAIAVMTACQSTTKNLGSNFAVKNPISVDAAVQQIKSNPTVENLQIEGKVEKSCMSEGCWFTLKDASGQEVLLDVKDKAFRVPVNSPGKTVIVLADAAQDTTTEQQFVIAVKGMRFK
jgi:hypothetical protein